MKHKPIIIRTCTHCIHSSVYNIDGQWYIWCYKLNTFVRDDSAYDCPFFKPAVKY